ncbi:MAG: VWA domain-containing protein [Thermoanaerobaculales bacterium]|nr:VWA domain-containing protein [Thermoanaerobaculales bacterium]
MSTHPVTLTARRLLIAGTLLLISTTWTGVGFSQDPDQKPLRAFFEPIDVPVVNVEVFVADKEGRPFPGLTAEDFEVFEDGEPVEITHFYASPNVSSETEATATETEGESVDPDRQLFLVVFVDDTNLSLQRRKRAFKHLRTMIDASIPEELRVMMVTYDGNLRIRRDFGPVNADLHAKIEEIGSETSISRKTEADRILRSMRNSANSSAFGGGDPRFSGSDSDDALREIETFAKISRDRTRRSLEVLKIFVRSLSGLPGRKAVLVVSDGIDVRPGEHLFATWEAIFAQGPGGGASRAFLASKRYSVETELTNLTKYANAQSVTFYVLSALIDRQMAMTSAANAGPISPGTGALALMSEEQALITFSGGTGGRVLVNSPALGDQLQEVTQELASYYSLGYQPDHLGDEKYHRFKVEVARAGLTLRYREGYLDTGPEERVAAQTLSAAVLGTASNPLGITVGVQQQEVRKDGTYLVPILIKVPLGKLVLIPQESEHLGQISILLATRGADGDLSEPYRREYPVRVPNDQLLEAVGKEAGYVMGLGMNEGPKRLAVTVRDEFAKETSTVTLDLVVGTQDG